MTDRIRALCAEMAAELDHNRRCLLDDATLTHPLADRARALLAADGPAVGAGEPTDAEILEVWCQGWDTSEAWGAIKFARAVLARWGNHSADASKMVTPPEGEVAELVAWLREEAAEQSPGDSDGLPSDVRDCLADATARLTRAAELLERQAAPVPVPVAERLPGPEDCDAKGRCWLTSTAPGTFPGWILDDPEQCVDWDRWLPAHALPLPAQAGEVEP